MALSQPAANNSKLHSMTNSPNAGADFCNQIPLHRTSLIQPHGILLVADPADLSLIQVSKNVAEIFQQPAEKLIGTRLQDVLEELCYVHLQHLVSQGSFEVSTPFLLTISYHGILRTSLSFIHQKDGALMIEVQVNESRQAQDFFEIFFVRVQQFISSINQHSAVDEVVKAAAREIKSISGFDKVMIYSFDEEWNGLVVAEEKEEGMDQYLGLKFPPTDIPKQARDLYLKNPYRIIPNRSYEPVPLVPALNSLTGEVTDLSDCKFRSVLPVHLEYLKNMKVEASMSTRIIHKEKLWGLIACHHRTPLYLSFQECFVFEYLSNILSSRIASISYGVAAGRSEQLDKIFKNISETIWKQEDPSRSLLQCKKELKEIFRADGMVVTWQGVQHHEGLTPGEAEVKILLEWLQRSDDSKVRQFNSLSSVFEPAQDYASRASGLLVIPVQPYEGNFVLAFRAEEVSHVEWGGNPNDVLTFEKGGRQYHPRNSFEIWKETVKYRASPWEREEMKIAERLRNTLVELTLKTITLNLEKLVEKRTSELENSKRALEATLYDWSQIIHVATHDLQEPARKITLYTSRVQEKVKDEEAVRYVTKLQSASKRISSLLRSLLNFSIISQEHARTTIDLNEVVEEVLTDFELQIEEKKAQITIGRLPGVKAVPEQMRQVFSSLLANSLKFYKDYPRIMISGTHVKALSFDAVPDEKGKYVRISVKDEGIGFPGTLSEKMFQLFQKLHTEDYPAGVGIGLSVVKKIIDKHGGIIMARGKEKEGAEIIFILPQY